MKQQRITLGYIPLVDAAPLIVAREMGFAAQEGLTFDLRPAQSWSQLRDMVGFGLVDGAHMLSPVPVATALGLGSAGVEMDALMVMSVNGNVIGLGHDLAQRVEAHGHKFGFDDPYDAGCALFQATDGPIRFGTPFPFSMHTELLTYWLEALPEHAKNRVEIRTIPPSSMARALNDKEVDAFCVGEPWGSIAVEQSQGALLLPGSAIWKRAPEKVLAVRRGWGDADPDLAHRLIRAVWRACQWLADPGSRALAGEMLARSGYLDVSSDILDRALTGVLTVSHSGNQRTAPGFLEFHNGIATFPWRSQAEWIATRLATRHQIDAQTARTRASRVFRSDVYRDALAPLSPALPGASFKIEGANTKPRPVASDRGSLILPEDGFFDGLIFDPSDSC